MKFLDSVDKTRVHPRLWLFLGWVDSEIGEWSADEEEITVTSLRREAELGKRRTKHAVGIENAAGLLDVDPDLAADYFVLAGDVRRWGLDKIGKADAFCRHVQEKFGDQVGVVLEPEWLSVDELLARGLGPITTADEEVAARTHVAPHMHFQLKSPILWTPFR